MTFVPKAEAILLAEISRRVIPESTYPRTLSGLRYGDDDLTPFARTLTFERGVAKAACEVPLTSPLARDRDLPQRSWNAPVEGVTEEGQRFAAPAGVIAQYSTSMSPTGGLTRLTVDCHSWSLGSGVQPTLWASALSTAVGAGIGNLTITGPEGFSAAHLACRGSRWTYYVLRGPKKTDSSTLAIAAHGEPVDHDLLDRELRALSFAVGRPLSCRFLVGLGDEASTIAFQGGDYGFSRLRRNTTASPVPEGGYATSTIALFQAIATHLAVESDPRNIALSEAMSGYVEALSEVNYASYEIKSLLACAAAARFFIGEEASLVPSTDAWAHWVELQRPVMESHASPGAIDELVNRVKQASSPGPREAIGMAIAVAGLHRNAELLDAVRVSTDVLEGRRQPGDEEGRIARLRTLCAGLVASAVGYEGPISGWHRAHPYYFYEADTEWRPARPGFSEHDDGYVAEVPAGPHSSGPAGLWPTFERPKVPEHGLMALVKDFADSLASRTAERVRGKIVPVPGYQEAASALYDFVLEGVGGSHPTTVLFTMRQGVEGGPIDVVNWPSAESAIVDEASLIAFLRSVAVSEETRAAVQRLLLAVDNV